jgi:hypothetical protein
MLLVTMPRQGILPKHWFESGLQQISLEIAKQKAGFCSNRPGKTACCVRRKENVPTLKFLIASNLRPRVDFSAMKKEPITCPDCNKVLKTVSYQIWGTKRFDGKTGDYKEDESLGNTDMEFTCPSCSAKLEPESILGF